MKKFIILAFIVTSMSTFAHVDSAAEVISARPSDAEIQSNRNCFQTLETYGCGDPGDDVEHFKSCMKNVLPDLDQSCQNLMKDLYQVK